MTTLQFSTKAQNLLNLRSTITSAQVKPLRVFTVGEWTNNHSAILDEIELEFSGSTVIVRSSVVGEDSSESSCAGAFLSVAYVNPSITDSVKEAIERVIGSYQNTASMNEFFVQEQITDISMSGVMMTCDLETKAPYYIINYDDETASHDSVTSGKGEQLKTWACFKNSPFEIGDFRLRQLVLAAKELEILYECEFLDIEFAFDSEDSLYILQVRPVVLKNTKAPALKEDVEALLKKIRAKYRQLSSPHYSICGKKAIFSVMSDWNPAEMIGIKPRPLALSLYKELITDSVWAYQRDNYGYRNLRSFPLLVSFMGYPYIDVRASFNSFIPRTLDNGLAEKLVDYYLTQLEKSPTDHDKVEFNIVFSCYYLSLPRKIKKLLNFGFSELELDRIKFALLNLTNNIVSPTTGLYKGDLKRIRELQARFDRIMHGPLSTAEKIYWLVEDGKRYGTLPFAGLARAAFIAVQFLQSFVDLNIISEDERLQFLNSLNTVARTMGTDCESLSRGELSKECFLEKYGHLRPGTYDILSTRYDESFETYFGSLKAHVERPLDQIHEFEFSNDQRVLISKQLVDNGILVTVDELLSFIREAIEGREYSKFIFTRNVSEVLRLISELGDSCGLDREALSYVDISTILGLYASLGPEDIDFQISSDVQRNRYNFELTASIKLPQLIAAESDIYQFTMSQVEPNFITRSRVTEIVILEERLTKVDLSNKIIFIKSADPGYDWLFSRNIGGLVTMFGGANSHMAIRCAELRIPAVIGCGEENFKRWGNAEMLDLDCASRQVRVIR